MLEPVAIATQPETPPERASSAPVVLISAPAPASIEEPALTEEDEWEWELALARSRNVDEDEIQRAAPIAVVPEHSQPIVLDQPLFGGRAAQAVASRVATLPSSNSERATYRAASLGLRARSPETLLPATHMAQGTPVLGEGEYMTRARTVTPPPVPQATVQFDLAELAELDDAAITSEPDDDVAFAPEQVTKVAPLPLPAPPEEGGLAARPSVPRTVIPIPRLPRQASAMPTRPEPVVRTRPVGTLVGVAKHPEPSRGLPALNPPRGTTKVLVPRSVAPLRPTFHEEVTANAQNKAE